jgi:hypothetical protein
VYLKGRDKNTNNTDYSNKYYNLIGLSENNNVVIGYGAPNNTNIYTNSSGLINFYVGTSSVKGYFSSSGITVNGSSVNSD